MSTKSKEKIKKLEYRVRVLEYFVKNQNKNTGLGRKYSLLDAETDIIMLDLDRE